MPDSFPPILSIFRFADRIDLLFMFFGFIGSLALGICDIFFTIFVGKIVNAMSFDREQIPEMLQNQIPFFINLTVSYAIGAFCLYFGWTITSERQAEKCRRIYFQSLLKKPIAYLETQSHTQLVESFNRNSQKLEKAINYNLGLIIMATSSALFRIIFLLVMGWQLALVCFSLLPAIILLILFLVRDTQKNNAQKVASYQKANSRSQQALFGIKTVKSYAAQAYELQTYKHNLFNADRAALFRYLKSALKIGGLYFILGGTAAIGLIYGSILVANGVSMPFGAHQVYEIGYVAGMIAMFSFGVLQVIRIVPAYTTFSEGLFAIQQIQMIIQNQQANSFTGEKAGTQKPKHFQGNIEFKGVSFSYDKENRSKELFSNFNAKFQKTEIALIGQSGNGKSTIFQLLLKLQTPQQGKIMIDGIDIHQIESQYWRQSIAYFTQSIFIFNGTIKQNLLFANPYATQQQIKQSLEMACFYEQVMSFPARLDFLVGPNGEKLSGGQRQRLSLARIFIKNKQKTRIYLLDDPISALDKNNAKRVLQNIRNHCQGKKIILITHNQRQMRNIRCIMKLDKAGKIQELDSLDEYIKSTKHIEIQNQIPRQGIQAQLKHKNSLKNGDQCQAKSLKQNQNQSRNSQSVFQLIYRVYALTDGLRHYLVIFWIACIIIALGTPLYGYQFGKIVGYGTNLEQLDKWVILSMGIRFVIMLLIYFSAKTVQCLMIEIFQHDFTNKMRQKYYQKVMNMGIQWFQKPQNNPSQITNFLSTQISSVSLVLISTSIIFWQIIASLLFACVLSLWIQWHVALITMLSIPTLIIFNAMSANVIQYTQSSFQQCRKNSYQFLGECLRGIKVVTANNAIQFMISRNEKLQIPKSKVIFNGILLGISFALTIMSQVFAHTIIYSSAVYLYAINDSITRENATEPIYCLEFSVVFSIYSLYFLKDVSKSFKVAKQCSFTLRQKAQYQDQENNMIQRNFKLQGSVEFKDVSFQYPSRKIPVLQNANFRVKPKETVFFIGSSGVGKSTIFSLLLGFYKPQSGRIMIDNKDIQQYDLNFLRKQFGLVLQQPTLFKGTILQNIKYNSQQNDEQILDFLMKMNLHNQFCVQKDQKLDRDNFLKILSKEVGLKGSNLSQGEKQRIAIYRQLIKGSQVLLLDEITASLDTKNAEKIYQLIDQVKKDKTIICISHKKEQTKGGSQVFQFAKQKINKIK